MRKIVVSIAAFAASVGLTAFAFTQQAHAVGETREVFIPLGVTQEDPGVYSLDKVIVIGGGSAPALIDGACNDFQVPSGANAQSQNLIAIDTGTTHASRIQQAVVKVEGGAPKGERIVGGTGQLEYLGECQTLNGAIFSRWRGIAQ